MKINGRSIADQWLGFFSGKKNTLIGKKEQKLE